MSDFSGHNIEDDYFTLRGIELRTGIKQEDLVNALLGEILDNGIDDQETHNVKNPYMNIIISKENVNVEPSLYPTFLRISVRDPVSPGTKHVFSKELLERIYKFGEYYGSKRIFKIHRGALGDASKLMLGAPYALADSMNFDISNDATGIIPIVLKSSTKNILKTFYISLHSIDTKQKSIIENSENSSEENYTEVQILLPYDDSGDDFTLYGVFTYLRNYSLLNTHITFDFVLPLFNGKRIHLPATQPMIKSDNKSSIHFYERHEFRQMVKDLSSKEDTFYDMFQRNFKSANNLPKNNLTMMSLGELSKSNEKIEKIFELRDKIAPISEDKNLGIKTMMPFKTSSEIRKLAIKNRLADTGISCESFKYKQDYGYYRSPNGVNFPYFFEVFIGRSKKDLHYNLKVIHSVNSKISKDSSIFTPDENTPYRFNYTEKHYRKAKSIYDIFEHYKYSHDNQECKRPNSIILVNLISPRIDYKSQGKSRIDCLPFLKVIAEVIEKACKGGNEKDGRPDRTKIVEDVVRERKEYYFALPQDNPVILKKHEWTLSDVFYAARKRLIEAGYSNEEIDRKYITGLIKPICAKLGVTREQIGIHAADRAQLYYKGKWSDVGLDEIDTLTEFGTDMVIIEKEGVISQIGFFADKKAIALLNTRGFAVDYASKLAKLASEKGCNISILVDWDVSGLLIFMILKEIIPTIKRIGVDFNTVEDLGLEVNDVEEGYTAPEKHLKPLEEKLANALKYAIKNNVELDPEIQYLIDNLDYLRTNRIEINSVMVELDDNAVFYNWLENRLRYLFTDRNFTRSYIPPEYVQPNALEKLNDFFESKGKPVLAARIKPLKNKLAHSGIKNAFLFDKTNKQLPDYNIKNYSVALTEQSKRIIENDNTVKPDVEDVDKLLKRLKAREKKRLKMGAQ